MSAVRRLRESFCRFRVRRLMSAAQTATDRAIIYRCNGDMVEAHCHVAQALQYRSNASWLSRKLGESK